MVPQSEEAKQTSHPFLHGDFYTRNNRTTTKDTHANVLLLKIVRCAFFSSSALFLFPPLLSPGSLNSNSYSSSSSPASPSPAASSGSSAHTQTESHPPPPSW